MEMEFKVSTSSCFVSVDDFNQPSSMVTSRHRDTGLSRPSSESIWTDEVRWHGIVCRYSSYPRWLCMICSFCLLLSIPYEHALCIQIRNCYIFGLVSDACEVFFS